MKQGWYFISNLQKVWTAHYVGAGNKTICSRYRNALDLEERIKPADNYDINEAFKCKLCVRILPFYQEHGYNKTEVLERKEHPNITRAHETSSQRELLTKTNSLYFVERECSEKNCKTKGLVAISTPATINEKPHYCTEHNPRVQDTIKEAVVA